MNKKTVIGISLFIVIGLSVYFIVQKPMLNVKDSNLIEEDHNETEEKYDINENNNEIIDEETETVTEKVRIAIVDSVRSAIDYIFSKETNIVAIGDSLTEGVGDESERSGYIGVLDRTINKDRKIANIINYGKRGNRTDQLLKRLDQANIKSSMKDANIILITIGANDIMKVVKENIVNLTYDQFAAEQRDFEERLRSIYMKLREYNAHAHIYLLGLYNPFYKYFGDIEELDLIVDEWNASGEAITGEFDNATFIPVKDIFVNEEESLFAEDHFHPNELGYYQMAGRVLQYLTSEERWAP